MTVSRDCGEWFLGMRGQEERQSTPTHTSGRWQNSRSVSNQFGLTRIQHTPCVSQYLREGGNEAGTNYRGPNMLYIFFTIIRFSFARRRGKPKFIFHRGPKHFSTALASAWQCKAARKFEDSGSHHEIQLNSVTPSTLQPWCNTLRFPPSLSGTKFETYVHVIRAVRIEDDHDKAW
jgi:hypothetical protein